MIPGIPGFRGDSNGRNRSSEFKESSRGQAASFRYTAQDRNPQTLARVSIQGEAGFARAYTIDAGQLKEAAAVPFGL